MDDCYKIHYGDKPLPLVLLPPSSLLVELLSPPAVDVELLELTEPVVSVPLLPNDWPIPPVEDVIFLLKSLKAFVSTICLIWFCGDPWFTRVSDVALEGDNFAVAPIINNINAKIKNTSL